MLRLPICFAAVVTSFAPLLHGRSWRHAEVLLLGAILAPGQRTVASILRIRMARPLRVRLYAGPPSAILARRILRGEPPLGRRTYGRQRFAAEGAEGLASKPRGRKPDEQRLLDAAQEAEIQDLIRCHTPDECKRRGDGTLRRGAPS